MKKAPKLTEQERDLLALWKAQTLSNKECARRLGRDPTTIGRELKRNNFRNKNRDYYVAIHAHSMTLKRRCVVAHSKPELKSPKIFAFVTKHLRLGWSPEQIAGRLKLIHKYDDSWWISPETIYRWIYDKKQMQRKTEGFFWYEYLRRKQKKRRKLKGRKAQRGHIPDRVSIHNRPQIIDDRVEFGHWEGDTVEGIAHRNGLHTEVERQSRFIMADKVARIAGHETIQVQKALFGQCPKEARKSDTLDNGRENHEHAQLRELDMDTYFADPYSSWQRGSNENGNLWIRYYFPKGTDFDKVDASEIQAVIAEINDRPRKILGFLTAKEMFTKLLKKAQGVAINC